MNVIEYKSNRIDIVFCCVDTTNSAHSMWAKELTKNIADYTISNIVSKKFSVYVGLYEDEILKHVTNLNYKYAVVFSTGTEFTNGNSFFTEIDELTNSNFFIAGHILDRGNAYYELHQQCYIVNLEIYKQLNFPSVGQQQLGSQHIQSEPIRSTENIHDTYTPLWIISGSNIKTYDHKCHGWNIISCGLDAQQTIKTFENSIRNNKRYYYPENVNDFNKQISWSYSRKIYCENELVNKKHTDTIVIPDTNFEYVITTASGTWYLDYLAKDKPVTILIYDYNQQALDYWKQHEPVIDNVSYQYIKLDLLGEYNFIKLLPNTECKTILNLSNIFCYEGNSMFADLKYRLYKENQLLQQIPKHYYVLFSERSTMGFAKEQLYGQRLEVTDINKLIKPTWHMNNDWVIQS